MVSVALDDDGNTVSVPDLSVETDVGEELHTEALDSERD